MNMYLSGKFYAKKLTVWKYLKMLKLALTFIFLTLKSYFSNISIYGLLLVNRHSQIYQGQQNAKEITPESLKTAIK